MISTVTTKGQTVVPAPLRRKLGIVEGTALDWQETRDGLRVVKLEPKAAGGKRFLKLLRVLGSLPEVPRDKRPVEPHQS